MSRFLGLSAFIAGFLKMAMGIMRVQQWPRERKWRRRVLERAHIRSASSRLSGHRQLRARANLARSCFFVNEMRYADFPSAPRDQALSVWLYSERAQAAVCTGSISGHL